MEVWERWWGKPFKHREAVRRLVEAKAAEMGAVLSGAIKSAQGLVESGRASGYEVLNAEQKMLRDVELQGALDGMLQLSALELATERGEDSEVTTARTVCSGSCIQW